MSLSSTIRYALQTAQLAPQTRWSTRRVERLAQRRLERLVRHAAEHSPYFHQKYAGVNLDRIRLTELPPTNKAELQARFDDWPTDRRLTRSGLEHFLADPSNLGRWYLDEYAVSHTSGSQGPPLVIVQSRRALSLLFSLMSARANTHAKPGIVEGWRRLRTPARVAVVAQHRGFYPSSAAFEFMAEITRPFTRVELFSSTDAELFHKLNDYQPNILVGYASVLEGLALASAELELRSLWQLANSSEQLTSRARERIEAAFHAPVLDHYGTGECLFLSDGCPTDGGAHVNADWAIVEVVDDDYQPVAPGELGRKVLVTNLANYAQPFVRYEVPDQVAWGAEPCRCGNHLPRIARIEGRSAEAFWIHDESGRLRVLPGVVFHSAIDALHGVRQWRAIQLEHDRVELQLEFLPTVENEFDAGAFVEGLYQAGLPRRVRVEVESVIGLQPDPQTGKYRRMVCLVSPPAASSLTGSAA